MFKKYMSAVCLLLSCISMASPIARAEEAQISMRTPQACWANEELAAKFGESDVRTGTAEPLLPEFNGNPADISSRWPSTPGTIRSVRLPPGKKLIALTFDLCESPHEIAGYQGEIVDILRANEVRATFFMVGKWMMTHRLRAQQLISDARFEIGNHTWAHRNLRLLTDSAATDEIMNAQRAYDRLRGDIEGRKCIAPGRGKIADESIPKSLSLFRFPFGACDPKSLTEVGKLGLVPIQWDVSSDDPDFKQTPELMKRKVLENVHPGSIVLFHANGRGWYTDDALPEIITELKARGYEFVTVTELLKAGEPVISPSCYDQSAGDTDRYDELARHLEEQ
jgi:peptidoglycan-N-acetylglucosamine deacetylase